MWGFHQASFAPQSIVSEQVSELVPRHLSTTQYANLKGISRRSVSKAITEGRLSRSVRRVGRSYEIDPYLVDIEWKGSTDSLRSGKRQPANHGMDYAEARRRRVIIEAALLKLEVAEREAQLVDAGAVETS